MESCHLRVYFHQTEGNLSSVAVSYLLCLDFSYYGPKYHCIGNEILSIGLSHTSVVQVDSIIQIWTHQYIPYTTFLQYDIDIYFLSLSKLSRNFCFVNNIVESKVLSMM